MGVAFVVHRLFAVENEAAAISPLDDLTAYYLLHRNDFSMAAARPAPASSTPSLATFPTQISPAASTCWHMRRWSSPSPTRTNMLRLSPSKTTRGAKAERPRPPAVLLDG